MSTSTRGPGSGLIKNPNPSRADVVFYTVLYLCGIVILWPFMLAALAYSMILSGPQIGWGFLKSHYYSCLYGE
jgi:hypothetical protein